VATLQVGFVQAALEPLLAAGQLLAYLDFHLIKIPPGDRGFGT
jgi:hypothetical protein